MELEAKIADLSFSARVHFLCNFCYQIVFIFLRNSILKIESCELNMQTRDHGTGLVGFRPIDRILTLPPRSGARMNGKR